MEPPPEDHSWIEFERVGPTVRDGLLVVLAVLALIVAIVAIGVAAVLIAS
jgi:hypothetical protein